MQIAMVNDKLLPAEELESIYFDRAIYFGDGIYEVVRSYNGRIFALEEHLQRFANGLAARPLKLRKSKMPKYIFTSQEAQLCESIAGRKI